MKVLFVFGVLVAACIQKVVSESIPELSFRGPFTEVDYKGDLKIDNNWRIGGQTSVKKNFIRVTPALKSHQGYIWNSGAINRDQFSIVLRFRISGTNPHWFGDGLAFWITTDRFHRAGDFHGYAEKYTGVGIVFDTYRNVEHAGGHKDVAVFINDGTKDYHTLLSEEVKGCDASLRFYEDHAQFSVTNHSRARISVNKDVLKVEIDEKAVGKWTACYEAKTTGLPLGWTKEAYLGITAATGSLVDNHDVLAVESFTEWNDAFQQFHDSYAEHKSQIDLTKHDGTPEGIVRSLQAQFNRLVEEHEHQIASLKESTRGALDKLHSQEALLEQRTAELERVVHETVEQRVESTLNEFAGDVDKKLVETMKEASGSSSWRLPFFLLVCIVGGFSYFAFSKYKQLRKDHLL